MNTEEVYRNLRKTTAEIQNYSFESKLDRDTNSKDSGISQMGGGGGGGSSRSGASGDGGGNGIGGVHSMIDSFAAMSASTCTLVANGSNGNNGHGGDAQHPYRAAAAVPSMGGYGFDGGLGDCDLSPSTATTTESNTPENTVRMDGALNGGQHHGGHRMHGGLGGGGGRGGGGGGGGSGGVGVTGGAGWATPEFKILEDGTLVFESEYWM